MRRNSDRSRVPSVSSGRVENSTFAATQRTETGIPKTRLTPSSRIGRRRSATSLKKLWASGKPRVTTAPSTPTGRQATISGLAEGLLLITSTISAQRSRRSWRVGPVRLLDAGGAAAGVGGPDGDDSAARAGGGVKWAGRAAGGACAGAGTPRSHAGLGGATAWAGIGLGGASTGWDGGGGGGAAGGGGGAGGGGAEAPPPP